MVENSSKSDQIRQLREIRMLAGEKIIVDCKADAKRDSKSVAIRKEPKAEFMKSGTRRLARRFLAAGGLGMVRLAEYFRTSHFGR